MDEARSLCSVESRAEYRRGNQIGSAPLPGVIVRAIAPALALIAFAVVLVPYLIPLARHALAQGSSHERFSRRLSETPGWRLDSTIFLAVVLIVAGGEGRVRPAFTLAREWHLPAALAGVLILACS